MKKNKKNTKKQVQSCNEQQPATFCRFVSYCDCCGCYDYAVCC